MCYLLKKHNLEVDLFKKGLPKISLGRPFSFCEQGFNVMIYSLGVGTSIRLKEDLLMLLFMCILNNFVHYDHKRSYFQNNRFTFKNMHVEIILIHLK